MDGDKFFIVSRGYTQSRYDPIFHRGLDHSIAGWEKVKRYASVKGGKRIPLGDVYAEKETGFYYLRVDNLTDCCEVAGKLKWLRPETFKTLERYRVFPGDVVVSIAGTIGRTAVINESSISRPTILTENCAKLHASSQILPEYLMLLLSSRPLQAQMERDYIQTTIPKLGLDRIRQLKIPPIPDLPYQQQTIELWQAAIHAYKQTLERANHLLSSIDNHLLAELGITLPSEPENSIANRIFTAQRRELAGWRFDARVHRTDFDLVSTRFKSPLLKQVAEINPRTTFRNIKDEMRLTFVPMEAITDEDGTINAPQERSFAENVGYTSFQEGDLLWAKITPCMENGKSAVAEGLLNGYGFGSTEYHVFRSKSDYVNIKYLHALLRMKRLRCAATRYFGGSSGHQRVDEAFFARLHIPLPDATKQEVIVEEIESRRTEARRLRADAETELENVKQRIEAMLLGEVTG